jgi:hypothetical protein
VTGRRPSGPRFRSIAAMAGAVIIAATMASCSTAGSRGVNASSGTAPPAPTPLAPIADYRNAVTIAIADHLRVWIEADMVKRWEEGPTWFKAAVKRVAALADRPGVAGIKIADELGYHDGIDSPAKIRKFLSDTAIALHAAAPGKLILVDMVVPALGCMPGHQPSGSPAARCAARALAESPQLSLPNIDSYLRMRAIGVLDLSTYLQTDSMYASWGTTADAAQADAWQQVKKRGWPALVYLQARKALAQPGTFQWTQSLAAADADEFIDIPLQAGAHAVDIWAWHQEYDGQMYQLMNPGMRPNALWSQLEQMRRDGAVLFTHMSPHSVQTGVRSDLAKIASVFTDVFLPAGTG